MIKGRVIKSTGKWCNVLTQDDEILKCRIRGKVRLEGLRTTNPVAVGDEVFVEKQEKEESQGVIQKIASRKNFIARKSINLSKKSQVIAANIDRAYLLVTLALPETHLAFVDRFLVSAESYRIPVSLIFNKMDIYFEEHLPLIDDIISIYEPLGYPCHKVSALKKDNISFLKDEINQKQVVISGHSGAGKSTLINALDPSLNIKTGEISEYHLQGQHTTTFAEMHQLSSGGFIIDTPGIKAFGVVDLEKSVISHYFPEMRKLLGKCKYHNCMHINEPDCAVKNAVENDEIHYSRYKTYTDLIEEDPEETYRKDIYG